MAAIKSLAPAIVPETSPDLRAFNVFFALSLVWLTWFTMSFALQLAASLASALSAFSLAILSASICFFNASFWAWVDPNNIPFNWAVSVALKDTSKPVAFVMASAPILVNLFIAWSLALSAIKSLTFDTLAAFIWASRAFLTPSVTFPFTLVSAGLVLAASFLIIAVLVSIIFLKCAIWLSIPDRRAFILGQASSALFLASTINLYWESLNGVLVPAAFLAK